MVDSLRGVTTRKHLTSTPQTQKATAGQKQNNAGGYSFVISDMERAKRFLIMGSESNFYTPGAKLSQDNAKTIIGLASDARTSKLLVDEIVAVSTAGRAPRQNPALFALAIAASHGDQESKGYALSKLPEVARTATALFIFAGYVEQFRGWGRALKRAIASWYTSKSVDQVAYQAVKYQNREGYTHRDLFRLSHPETADTAFQGLGEWILRGNSDEAPATVKGFVKAQSAPLSELPALIREYRLTWEMLPTQALNEVSVWEALLDGNVPLGALIRQLPRLTRIGVLKPLGGLTKTVADRITDEAELAKARIHPINVLIAHKTYASGRSERGSSTWTPVTAITDALDKAFYLAFKTIEPANKRTLIGVDVSYSMTSPAAGLPISSAEVAGAMALVTMATEPQTEVVGFSHQLVHLPISPTMRLADVMRLVQNRNFGGTNSALLVEKAIRENLEVDTFITITDNETWAGTQHTHEALEKYRRKTGIDARMIVLATTASEFSIADPNDSLSLDVAGFDSATPALIADFSRGF